MIYAMATILFISGLKLKYVPKSYFSYFSTKTYVVGTLKNHLNETGFFEHPKHMFKLMD